jgi:uncharacterized protein
MDNIDFPFHFDQRGRTAQLFDHEAGRNAHVRNLIEQFLFTEAGERINRPDFGSGLLQLVFAPNSPELAATLRFTVQAGLQRWLGDLVEIQDLEVVSEDSTLRLHLQYQVLRTGEVRQETFEQGISQGSAT